MRNFILSLFLLTTLISSYAYGFGSILGGFNQITQPVGNPSSSGEIAVNLNTTIDNGVYVPDTILNKRLKTILGKEEGEAITIQNMQSLTKLDLSSYGIKDITGLEYAINLTHLNLGNNQITDITPLANLIQLTELDIQYNQIKDIRIVCYLSNLTLLRASYNLITDINVFAHPNMSNLKKLYLNGNMIINITALGAEHPLTGEPILINLTHLDISDNKTPRDWKVPSDHRDICGKREEGEVRISDLSPIAGLINLVDFAASQNDIKDISALANLGNLEKLELYDNFIEDIRVLENFKNLVDVNLCANRISDLGVFKSSALVQITDLNLSQNRIKDISSLSNLTNIVWLFLHHNFIDNISALVNNPGLYNEFPDDTEKLDTIDIRFNKLDLTRGSDDMQDIHTLERRCVKVNYLPQDCNDCN